MTFKEIAKKFKVKEEDLLRRGDGRIEWICEHGVGHTVYAPDGNYEHGCDGCCSKIWGNLKEEEKC